MGQANPYRRQQNLDEALYNYAIFKFLLPIGGDADHITDDQHFFLHAIAKYGYHLLTTNPLQYHWDIDDSSLDITSNAFSQNVIRRVFKRIEREVGDLSNQGLTPDQIALHLNLIGKQKLT